LILTILKAEQTLLFKGWGLGLNGKYNSVNFFAEFCNGICGNLSADTFSDALSKNFPVKTKKGLGNCYSPMFHPLLNYNIAAPKRQHDCSIPVSRGSPPQVQKFLGGISPPHT